MQTPSDQPFHLIKRSAHVIKGASANLMCQQLYEASKKLEAVAIRSNSGDGPVPQYWSEVQSGYLELQKAVTNYKAFLRSIGI